MNPFLHDGLREEPGRVVALAGGWRARVLSDSSAILAGDGGHLLLSGGAQVSLLRLLDGSRTRGEAMETLAGLHGEAAATATFGQFLSSGLLEEPSSADPSPAPYAPLDERPDAPVHLHRLVGSDGADRFARAFQEAGIPFAVSGDGREARLRVVVASDPGDPRLDALHREQRRRGQPWIAVVARGSDPGFMPLLRRGDAPCWECAAFWLRVNRPVEEFIRRDELALFRRDVPAVPDPVAEAVARRVAGEVQRFLSGAESAPWAFTAFDRAAEAFVEHPVRRRPQCPVCGDPRWMRSQGERPVVLEEVGIGWRREGGFRTRGPDEAVEAVRHLVSHVCGPVSQLGPMPRRHRESRPVFVSGFRVCPHAATIEPHSFQRVCAGKGKSVAQARASALFEAVERFSGAYQGDEPILRATAEALGPQALRPHDLQLYSERQYLSWSPDHAAGGGALRIARPCAPDVALDWTPGWSLVARERRWVPFAYCWSDTPPGIDRSHVCFTGNGVAAGSCLEEAVLQGLLELVERDAVAVWWYNRIPRPEVPEAYYQDPWVRGLRTEYDALGWDLWGLDLAHDLGIPVHAALARSRSEGRWSIGFGCHPDPALSFQRALTEVNQVFDPRGELRPPWDVAAMDSDHWLRPHGRSEAVSGVLTEGVGLLDVVRDCVDRLARAGMDVVVVNKSRPDTGVAVAQVVVPGLRHFWPRFGAGRLYSVPVNLGWLEAPLSEEELNPIPLVL